MKYYKQETDGVLVSFGITEGDLAENQTELTKEAYDALIIQVAAEDKARAEAAEKAAEEARKKAEEEAAAHKALIEDYVAKVKAGTIAITDIPEEYRTEVDSIINPPLTPEETKTQMSAMKSAIDFLMLG